MARSTPHVPLGSTNFGAFSGFTVYYEGFDERPKFLKENGKAFAGMKHLLEVLREGLGEFKLTFTPDRTDLVRVGKGYRIYLSALAVRQFGQSRWTASREMSLRLARQLCSRLFPNQFSGDFNLATYQRDMFAAILDNDKLDPRVLSPRDRAAITRFVLGDKLKGADSSLDIPTAYEAKRSVQLVYVRRLLAEFEARIAQGHDEAYWQTYFEKNILFFQESYIRRLPRMNVDVVGTSFPDFAVLTSDQYLDIIEIKKPTTQLLNHDKSRNNFYWNPEIAKAISQVENYLECVTKLDAEIRARLRDTVGIELRVIRPRGLIIAGHTSQLGPKKAADDFRRLNEGLKNVLITPYDELSQRLANTIESIERLSSSAAATMPSEASRRRTSPAAARRPGRRR